jgi:hypothetical protein
VIPWAVAVAAAGVMIVAGSWVLLGGSWTGLVLIGAGALTYWRAGQSEYRNP